jgi:hypothetical protein
LISLLKVYEFTDYSRGKFRHSAKFPAIQGIGSTHSANTVNNLDACAWASVAAQGVREKETLKPLGTEL